MGIICDRQGKVATAEKWREEMEQDPNVQVDMLTLDGSEIRVWSRFTGVAHGVKLNAPMIWEVSIDGDGEVPSHATFDRRSEAFTTQAACLSRHAEWVDELTAAGAVRV